MKKVMLVLLVLLFTSVCNAMIVENGATSVITYFVLRDQTAGTVDVGVTLANIDLYYIEEQIAISAKVDAVAHAAATDAWDDGEVYHCGYGVYRVDWPDAAFDGGIGKKVQLIVIDGDAGAFTEVLEVELSPPVNVITVAGTSQTGNDNGADINAVLTDTEAADTTTEIRTLLTGADTPVAKETTSTTISTAVGNIETDTAAVDTTTEMRTFLTGGDTAVSTITTAQVNTEADNAFATYDPPTKAEMDTGHGLLATEAKQDIMDTNVDDIEADTAAVDTTSEMRTFLTGGDTAVSTVTAAGVWTVTMSDLAAVPAYNASALDAVNYLFEYFRNKMTVTVSEIALLKDDAATPFTEANIDDDDTTFTRGEFGAVD